MALEGNSRGLATILGRDRRELEVEIATSPIVDKESGFTNGVLSVIRPVNTAVSQCPDAVAVATDATQP